MVHFTVDAPLAMTEDVRELAEDIGDERALHELKEGGPQTTTVVGRFGSRSRVKEGDTAEVAADTRSLHFFDPASGLAVYGSSDKGATE
jgi:multiple sugar transport system ATP-binding protein